MNSKKKDKKKGNPYFKLAMFTIASASVINTVNRVKSFVSEKTEAVTDFFRDKMTKDK